MQKVTPCLWFDMNAEEAMNFYTSLFDNGKIVSIMRYPDEQLDGPPAGMAGKVLTGIFEIYGQQFMCLDGGPVFTFNEAVSFQVECDDQAEVDRLWEALSAVPASEQCGWLKDKFGVSWQIVPKRLGELLNDKDAEKASRALHAMLKMKKINVADLEKAAKG
jgi:predicted 3-demethylubiquinone-9 3-methyltransferase (glyoxalase superfamily)